MDLEWGHFQSERSLSCVQRKCACMISWAYCIHLLLLRFDNIVLSVSHLCILYFGLQVGIFYSAIASLQLFQIGLNCFHCFAPGSCTFHFLEDFHFFFNWTNFATEKVNFDLFVITEFYLCLICYHCWIKNIYFSFE